MKKLEAAVNLYCVFARDVQGFLYLLHGNQTTGVMARPITKADVEGREAMKFFSDYGLSRQQFMLLHKALAKDDSWTDATIYNETTVKLVPTSVFYRQIKFGFAVVALEPVKVELEKPKPKSKAAYIKVTNSTCHYKSNCVTFDGDSYEALKFGYQIVDFIDKHLGVSAAFSVCAMKKSSEHSSCQVQVTLVDPGKVRLGTVRKVVQEAFA